MNIACALCHTADSWKMRSDAKFDHGTTGFALEGRHGVIPCASCHEKLVFTLKGHDCLSCHIDVHKSELGDNCVRCHTLESWIIPDMKEKHQQTRFPLVGQHAYVPCESCHDRISTHQYAGTPLECISCHRNEFQTATNPSHTLAQFPVDCSRCHSLSSTWGTGFNHNQTAFPLTGAHQSIICLDCHKNNRFVNIPTDCYSCHADQFINSPTIDHVEQGFSHNCTQCHSTAAWAPSTFSHDATRFPLTGTHVSLDCQACHTRGNYALTYTNCYQCHLPDYQQATDPNHVADNFSHDCTTCHNTTAWNPATFDHSTTNFPLTGKHSTIDCQSCHTNGNYQLTYSNCYQCHQTNFQQATNPNHQTTAFTQICQSCHTTTAWSPALFDHTPTNFQLTGSHVAVQCLSCHTGGNYQIVFTNCYQCHQTAYQQPTNPNHVTNSFSYSCQSCHTTTAWTPSTFDHNSTALKLDGKHATIDCASCHTNGNYQLHYTDCYTCHQTEYTQPTDPNHVTNSFSHACQSCHTTTAWTPSTFDHNSTAFKLTGRHLTITCISCHTNGNYQLHYTDCYACHQTQYEQTTDPNHVARNYSHDCSTCHNTTSWGDGAFKH